MPRVPKTPAKKDWNDVIAFLERWKSESHVELEGFSGRLARIDGEVGRMSKSMARLEEDVMPVLLGDVQWLKGAVTDLRADNAKFLARLNVVEIKLGLT